MENLGNQTEVFTESGNDFETETLYAIETIHPTGILLDVRLGEYREDQFKGLEILHKIVGRYPDTPVLMFTQYTQGPGKGHCCQEQPSVRFSCGFY
ncbi:MAG: hypothetical protein CM1200mP15_17420 [Dehalococcoidia bacterium]|nr:MAG: hypothetical protein CM1200mP15_17420 [Dehalococcoidia bacterium]